MNNKELIEASEKAFPIREEKSFIASEEYPYSAYVRDMKCHRTGFIAGWQSSQTPAALPVVDKKDFLTVLDVNYQAQIAGYYNDDKTDEERKIRNAVIEEYQDLIAIYKSNYDIQLSLPVVSGGEKMYRWVKASERLPSKEYSFGEDESGCFPVRWSFEYRTFLGLGYIDEKVGTIYNAMNLLPLDIEDVEWCDESPLPSPVTPVNNSIVYFLKEVLVEVEWMFDNMRTPHTSDHFNRPANLVQQLKDALDQWQTISHQNNAPVRSAEEVLLKYFSEFQISDFTKQEILKSMEEYANQFKGTTPAVQDTGKWISVSEDIPPVSTLVDGYNKKWVDEDYNPEGIRECFLNQIDDKKNTWVSAKWNNEQDCWESDEETKPTQWKQRYSPTIPLNQ